MQSSDLQGYGPKLSTGGLRGNFLQVSSVDLVAGNKASYEVCLQLSRDVSSLSEVDSFL